MCGIGGILRRDGGAISDEWLDTIDARIAYRGPDGHGTFRDRVEADGPVGRRVVEVGLVHRRLAVIDPDSGSQPMISESGNDDSEGLVAVVFNGCIYNHRALRDELERAGRVFATDHSDTEVLIHGYRQWGESLEDHLEGMYAFALWDRANVRLMLVRDRFGEKPLYVRTEIDGNQTIAAFASDAHALAMLGDHPLPQDHHATQRWTGAYLQLGYNWKGRTVYDGMAEQADGGEPHDATSGDGSVDNDQTPAGPGVRNNEPGLLGQLPLMLAPFRGRSVTIDDVDAALDASVAARLESDVPLGCLLSGGVDSSLIAHYARRHRPDLRTFALRMNEPAYDESEFAEQVAADLNTDHQTLNVAPNPAADIEFLVRTLGQPFGDSSILPTYWICQAAREHVTVLLSGDGGDELFAGYERYQAVRLLEQLRWLWMTLPSQRLSRHHPKSGWHKLGRMAVMAREFGRLGVLATESIFPQSMIRRLMGTQPADPPHFDARRAPDAGLRQIDLQSYLPDDLLTKVDTASMAVDVEVRCPFLDSRVAGAALSLPMHRLMAGGKRKAMLRELARRHLPPSVVDRPKMGFAIPIDTWFRTDFGGMQTLLADRLAADQPFGPIELDRAAVDGLVREHLAGRAHHGQRLFTLLTLAIWAQDVCAAAPQRPATAAIGPS